MCLSNYGDAAKFSRTFSAISTKNLVVKNSPEKLICSKIAPTLTVVKATYGVEVLQTIIADHIINAAKYYGTHYASDSEQVQLISNMIIANHPDLKISEIILFFSKLEAGFFRDNHNNDAGKMYGNFNGEVIADCLHRFREYRTSIIDKMEREEASPRLDEARNNPNAISYNEWLRMTGKAPDPIVEMVMGKAEVQPSSKKPYKQQTSRSKTIKEMLASILTPEQMEEYKAGKLDPNKYKKQE